MRMSGPLAAALLWVALLPCLSWADGAGIRQLPVPTSTIAAGQVIGAADLSQRKFQTTARSLAGIATEAEEITGKETRRRLLAGRPIPLAALMKPLAIRRGAKVTAVYETAGLSISTRLTALEDGATGDVISLRNIATGSLVQAKILPSGKVVVNGE
jgi:flagella basal body P-ring formation protein FlgA